MVSLSHKRNIHLIQKTNEKVQKEEVYLIFFYYKRIK